MRLLRRCGRPDAVEELADLGGQPGRPQPQFGERAGPDQPGVWQLPGEPSRVGERVDQVDPVSQDQRRGGDGPALVASRGDRAHQDAVQHGGDLIRVRCGGTDERADRAEPCRGQACGGPGDPPQRGPRVVHPEQERQEDQRRRRDGRLQHRHFQDQAADPLRCSHGGEQAHVGTQRDPAEHRLIRAQLVQQAQHLLRVKIHPVGASVAGLLAPAMTQQVEQHDPVALGGQCPGQAAAEVGVQQQAMQPHEHPVARAVDLIGQPVLTPGHRMACAFGARAVSPGCVETIRRAGPRLVTFASTGGYRRPENFHT